MIRNRTVKYDNHEKEWEEVLNNPSKASLGESWFRKDTIDAWRHNRMRSFIDPFVDVDNDLSWITIGDGRYGTDANYLLCLGAKHVHATDISDKLLSIGSKNGFINTFSAENAEFLSCADNSYDYVLCKDALHHCPRPFIALDEMFRVAKKAVIFIEPRDQLIDRSLFFNLYGVLRKLFLRPQIDYGFESVGNYVYSFSEREVEKFMLGMHFRYLAFAGCNDAYINGVEYFSANPKNIPELILNFRIRVKIIILNLLTLFKFRRTGTLICALFKDKPSDLLKRKMQMSDWNFKELPVNPYL